MPRRPSLCILACTSYGPRGRGVPVSVERGLWLNFDDLWAEPERARDDQGTAGSRSATGRRQIRMATSSCTTT